MQKKKTWMYRYAAVVSRRDTAILCEEKQNQIFFIVRRVWNQFLLQGKQADLDLINFHLKNICGNE